MRNSTEIFLDLLDRWGSLINFENENDTIETLLAFIDQKSNFIDKRLKLTDKEKQLAFEELVDELADCYVLGKADELLKNLVEEGKCKELLVAINEQKEIIQSLRNSERKVLKSRLADLDINNELEDDRYIEQALKNNNRRDLKQFLSELDKSEISPTTLKGKAKILNINFMMKVAAAIAIIAIPGYIIFNDTSEKQGEQIAENTAKESLEPSKVKPVDLEPKHDELAKLDIPNPRITSYKKSNIRLNNYGYSTSNLEVDINLINLNDQIEYLNKELLKQDSSQLINGRVERNLKLKKDSIVKLIDTYSLIEKLKKGKFGETVYGSKSLTLYTLKEISKVDLEILQPECILSLGELKKEFRLILKVKDKLFGLEEGKNKKLIAIEGEVNEECEPR